MRFLATSSKLRFIEYALAVLFLLAPLWALLDFGFDLNLKVSLLESSLSLRIGYYVVILALGVLMWRFPRIAPPLGVVESGIHVTLIVLSVFLPYVKLLESASEGGELTMPQMPWGAMVLNVLILSLGIAGSWGEVMHGRKSRTNDNLL